MSRARRRARLAAKVTLWSLAAVASAAVLCLAGLLAWLELEAHQAERRRRRYP